MGPGILICKLFLWHTSGSEQLSFHSTIKKLAPLWGHSQEILGHRQPQFGDNFLCMDGNSYRITESQKHLGCKRPPTSSSPAFAQSLWYQLGQSTDGTCLQVLRHLADVSTFNYLLIIRAIGTGTSGRKESKHHSCLQKGQEGLSREL